MDRKCRGMRAAGAAVMVILVLMLAVSCAVLAGCGKSDKSGTAGKSTDVEEPGDNVGEEIDEEPLDDENGGGVDEKDLIDSGEGAASVIRKDFDTEKSVVTGKCYVFTAMSSEDEDFDDELLKEMFDIKDLGEYMTIVFEKGGTAYVSSLLYDGVQKCKWGEAPEGVILLEVGEDLYEFEAEKGGKISAVTVEEDGEGFLITLTETKKIPDELAEYVK